MVRLIAQVETGAGGSSWYRLDCSHLVIALDYAPTKGPKARAFCPICWRTARTQPVKERR